MDRTATDENLKILRNEFHNEWTAYQVRGQLPKAEEKKRMEELDRYIKALDEVLVTTEQGGVLLTIDPLRN